MCELGLRERCREENQVTKGRKQKTAGKDKDKMSLPIVKKEMQTECCQRDAYLSNERSSTAELNGLKVQARAESRGEKRCHKRR